MDRDARDADQATADRVQVGRPEGVGGVFRRFKVGPDEAPVGRIERQAEGILVRIRGFRRRRGESDFAAGLRELAAEGIRAEVVRGTATRYVEPPSATNDVEE